MPCVMSYMHMHIHMYTAHGPWPRWTLHTRHGAAQRRQPSWLPSHRDRRFAQHTQPAVRDTPPGSGTTPVGLVARLPYCSDVAPETKSLHDACRWQNTFAPEPTVTDRYALLANLRKIFGRFVRWRSLSVSVCVVQNPAGTTSARGSCRQAMAVASPPVISPFPHAAASHRRRRCCSPWGLL